MLVCDLSIGVTKKKEWSGGRIGNEVIVTEIKGGRRTKERIQLKYV